MKTKKILSVALAILMLMGTFAVGASAADSEEITETDFYVANTYLSEGYYLVADGGITAENASASNYNVKFTPATANANARITFNNAKNINKPTEGEGGEAIVAAGGKLDVELIGENSLSGGLAAFSCADDINFIGEGSISYTTDQDGFINVFTISNNITVSDKVQINVNTPDNIIIAAFATLEGGVIIKDNSKVNIKNTGVGIIAPGLTVCDNAELTVDAARRYGGAVEVIGDVSISGNAVVNLSTTRDIGYISDDDDTVYALNIENGNLSVSGNAKLTANAGTGYSSYGVYIEKSGEEEVGMTLSDSAFVKGVTGKSENRSAGVYCDGNITVSGNAKLQGVGGSKASFDDGNGSEECFGIYAEELLEIKDDAQVNANGGMAELLSCSVSAENINTSGTGGISTFTYNTSNGPSIGVLSRNNINMCEKSYIVSIAGKSPNGNSEGIKTVNLTATDKASIDGTGDLADISVGIHVEKNTVLSDDVHIDAGACDATTAASGFFTENFTASDNVIVRAQSNDASQSFAFTAKTFAVSDSVEIYGKSDSEQDSAIGVLMNDSTTIGSDCKIEGVAVGASDGFITAGVYCDGILTVNGNASVSGESVWLYGIMADELVVAENAALEADGYKQAVYCQTFTMYGNEDRAITVVRSDMSEQEIEWDGAAPLGSLDSFYSYVSVTPAEPEPELNFFEQLIANIVEFFNSIRDFFSSLFSF